MRCALFVLILLPLSQSGFAASIYKKALVGKKNQYVMDGVFVGGKAGNGSSLLGVRRTYSSKVQVERIIVDIGDKEAKPAGNDMGYFQVNMDSRNKRVIIDLAQLKLSKVSEDMLKNAFKKSAYVASAELTLDPEDKAGTMILNLKKPMRVEVFQLLDEQHPARLVIDMTPRKGG